METLVLAGASAVFYFATTKFWLNEKILLPLHLVIYN